MARTPVLPMLFSRYSSSANFARVRSPTGVSKLPLALKIGSSVSSLSPTALELSKTTLDALVLFNRFYRFDFDIDALKMVPAPYMSSPDEMAHPLRWVSILSGRV